MTSLDSLLIEVQIAFNQFAKDGGFDRITNYPDDAIEREFIDEDMQHCYGKKRGRLGLWREDGQGGHEQFRAVLWRDQRIRGIHPA